MVDAVGLFDFRFVFGLYGGTVVAFAEVVLLSANIRYDEINAIVCTTRRVT